LISLNTLKPMLAKMPLNRGLLLLSACALCAWLALGSWDFIQQLPAQPAQSATAAEAPKPLQALDTQGITRMFGATPPEMQRAALAVPLTLLASLTAGHSKDSRALIRAPDSTAFYSIGDRLPGGVSLSSINPDHIVVLGGGLEQTLAFPSHTARLLTPTPTADALPPPAEMQP